MITKKEEIKEIYKKIKIKIEYEILEHLRKKGLVPKDKKYDLAPDFDSINEWKITTNIRKAYSEEESYIEKEEIVRIKGRLYITKYDLNLDPSFSFEIDQAEKSFQCNPLEIKKIIEADKENESWQKELLFDRIDSFTVFDAKLEKIKKKLQKEVTPLLSKSFGFSEDESNMMIIGAMGHEKFTEDISPEGLIGLALRIRGEGLNKKK